MSEGKNRIMIFGPKDDGTRAGEALAISIPRTECAVIQHFQERTPYGLFVPEFREEYSTDLPKSKKTNSPRSLSRWSSERTDSMNAFRQLRQSGPLSRKHDDPSRQEPDHDLRPEV